MAVVREVVDYSAGIAKITYVVEPSETYEVCVKSLLQDENIKLENNNEIEQFYEVGASIKVKWTKEEIAGSNWRPGWYVAEVQESDQENDEITVKFLAQPAATYTYEVTPCVSEGKIQMKKPVF